VEKTLALSTSPESSAWTGFQRELLELGVSRPYSLRMPFRPWKRSRNSGCAPTVKLSSFFRSAPDYESLPLAFFEPMVRRVFAAPRYLDRG
jgi:hypothetical protein